MEGRDGGIRHLNVHVRGRILWTIGVSQRSASAERLVGFCCFVGNHGTLSDQRNIGDVPSRSTPPLRDCTDHAGWRSGACCWPALLVSGALTMATVSSSNRKWRGWAATSGAAIIAMVSPWFDRRRALALGHALNGASAGGVLFAPVWVTLIAIIGFERAVAAVGAVMFVVLGPLIWWYLRPTPEGLGLAPDGDDVAMFGHRSTQATDPPANLGTLLSSRKFTTLSAAFALGLFAQVGAVAHLVTRLAPLVGIADAAAAVSLTTASAIVGRLLLGGLLGDADRRSVAAGNFIMQAGGVLLLAIGTTSVTIVPGCVLFGLGIGNLLTLPPLIAQREFASSSVPRVVALVTAVNQAVFAFAPAILGILREVSGGYLVPFLTAAVVQIVAASVIVIGRNFSPA
jgi:Major Facilitator Superfamily